MLHTAIQRARQVRRNGQAGFTLIELLIVIVILGVLASIVVFSVRGITNKADTNACKAEVSTVATAEESAYAQDGKYYDLTTLVSKHYLRSNPTYVLTASDTDGSMTTDGTCPAA